MNGKEIFKICLKVVGTGVLISNIMGCGAVARSFVEEHPDWNPRGPIDKYLKFIGSYDYDQLWRWIEARRRGS